jgi:mediator of RNA polymerase II transcription subunit 16, fungi type
MLPVMHPVQLPSWLRRGGAKYIDRTIAWSRSGTIATVSRDGKTLQLRFLRSNPEDGSWDLSEPTTCDLITASSSATIVHLDWASTNSPELAVIDSLGRVAILTFSITLNRPLSARKWDFDPVDDMYAVVGSFWLPLTPQNRQVGTVRCDFPGTFLSN